MGTGVLSCWDVIPRRRNGVHSMRMTSQLNSNSLLSKGYSEWVLPKDEGEAGLPLLDGMRILTVVGWPCEQSQSTEPGSKMEEWSSHEVW